MKSDYRCGCVLLAAGLGSRFGGNKLHADINGISMIERALDTLASAKLTDTVVVSFDKSILDAAKKHGFAPVINDAPEEGISRSIRLGLEHLSGLSAVMFMVADQPGLTKTSIQKALEVHKNNPHSIVSLSHNGKRGNPCIFPAELYGELMALEGDVGGSAVISVHSDILQLVEVGEEELLDVDDKETWAYLNAENFTGHILHPRLSVRLYTSDKCFGPGIAHLLQLVDEHGSLRAAASAMNMSYSKAWKTVCRCEELLGFPLMLRTNGGKNGGGAQLTADAKRLLDSYQIYCTCVDKAAKELFREVFSSYLDR